VTGPVDLQIFAELNAVLGRGESAAITIAANRHWMIAKDELGRARREVYERVGRDRLINTPGLILSCVCTGALTVADADGSITVQLAVGYKRGGGCDLHHGLRQG